MSKIETDSKKNILKVAFALFLEKGYNNVTIKQIMDISGLSKGAIYHHFSNKEEIYTATLELYFFELLDPKEIDISESFIKNIEIMYTFISDMFDDLENLISSKTKYPIRNFYFFQLESEKNDSIREKIELAVMKFRKRIEAVVLAANNNNQIKAGLNTEAITYQIIALIEGTAIHHSTLKENIKQELMQKYKLIFDSYLQLITK